MFDSCSLSFAGASWTLIAACLLQVVPLKNAHLLAPERYPRLTLIGQAYGSVRLAYAALKVLRPQVWHPVHGLSSDPSRSPCPSARAHYPVWLQIFIDTSGWAFMYPLVRLAGVKVACYTHYPTISTNMLLRVAHQKTMYNNSGVASTLPGALLKMAYYYLFACFYGMAGGCANVSPSHLLDQPTHS